MLPRSLVMCEFLPNNVSSFCLVLQRKFSLTEQKRLKAQLWCIELELEFAFDDRMTYLLDIWDCRRLLDYRFSILLFLKI